MTLLEPRPGGEDAADRGQRVIASRSVRDSPR